MTIDPTAIAERFLDRVDECRSCLQSLLESELSVGAIKRIRQRIDEPLVSLVLESARLQRKAVSKLGRHDVLAAEDGLWWVTEQSLQQATPWQVAKFKAKWFTAAPVTDLCCGIGGDAAHFSMRSSVTAIDRNPIVAALAHVNLECFSKSELPKVICADVLQHSVPSGSQVHVDPDRRASGRRSTDPNFYEPSWDAVMGWARDHSTIVKLAPAAQFDSSSLVPEHHRCWISLQRTVREQSLLCGEVVERARLPVCGRSAVVVSSDGSASVFTFEQTTALKLPTEQSPQNVLIDPDPAIRAAGLTEAFAERFQLHSVGSPSGFLTTGETFPGDWPVNGFAIVSPVIWHGPCDLKKIRRELRSRNAFVSTVKVRGTDHNPAKIQPKLRQTGEEPCTLWIGRNQDRVYAALTPSIVTGSDQACGSNS